MAANMIEVKTTEAPEKMKEPPKAIDPDRVQAQIREGMLSLKAEIAGAKKSRVPMLRAA